MGFFSKSRRNAMAPLVLAMWLFGLAVSVAHACGVDEVLAHAGLNTAASAKHHAPTNDELPLCDQFCIDDIPLIGKLKAVEDLSPGAAVVAPTTLAAVRVPTFPRVYDVLPRPDPPPSVAINTRFIRLAL